MSAARHVTAAEARAAPRVTVVIADDHELMRRSLRRLLEQTAGIDVIAEAGDLALTAQHVVAHRPDVLVLDLHMPDGSSLELVDGLAGRMPQTRVVVVSVEDAVGFARRALAAGAGGYVLKQCADSELAQAVRIVRGGGQYDSAAVAGGLAAATPHERR
jgi:two-component system response regulator NreC